MNYLIFGGDGFIGQHLIRYLINDLEISKSRIYSLDIKNSGNYENYHKVDVRKPIDIQLSDLSNSIIFNLAAVHTTPGHPDYEYFETNIKGAENICNFAELNGISKIVFTSSIAPYGASEEEKNEDSLPTPNTPYGISKLIAEYIFRAWQGRDSISRKLSIVRPGVVFGKGEGGNFTRLYEAQRKGFFFYPGRKDTLKASVYVKDVVRILFSTIHDMTTQNTTLYNLTYFPPPSIETICCSISDIAKVSKPRAVIPAGLLKIAASAIYFSGLVIGKKFTGIHPDRVKKLMVSTNINGEKLENSEYKLKFSLMEALEDWFKDCGRNGLF